MLGLECLTQRGTLKHYVSLVKKGELLGLMSASYTAIEQAVKGYKLPEADVRVLYFWMCLIVGASEFIGSWFRKGLDDCN